MATLQVANRDDSAPLAMIWLAVGDASIRDPSSPLRIDDPSPPLCIVDGDLVELDEALILEDEVILNFFFGCSFS